MIIKLENGENHCVLLIQKELVESAVRKLICEIKPEYAAGWVLNPQFNIADIIFAGTKI